MGREIERKFRVVSDGWLDGSAGVRMSQGYLAKGDGRTVRVRIAGADAWLTVKGPTSGISRAEFEYPIPVSDALEMLLLCGPGIIDKTRHRIPHAGKIWEVDVFHGDNDGLIVAEIELLDEAECPELPSWVGDEVSRDFRYSNSRLSEHPYRCWAGSASG